MWTILSLLLSVSLSQCRMLCKDVSAETMYDVLHDIEYRRKWDTNVSETFDIGKLTVNADVGYYSCMSHTSMLTCAAFQKAFVWLICNVLFWFVCNREVSETSSEPRCRHTSLLAAHRERLHHHELLCQTCREYTQPHMRLTHAQLGPCSFTPLITWCVCVQRCIVKQMACLEMHTGWADMNVDLVQQA